MASAAIGMVLWITYGGAYVSIDAMWSLVWGRDLIHGAALSVSGTTTPHLLSNLLGAVLTPLGADADRGLIAIEFLSAGGLVWLVSCSAREIAGLGAGLAAGFLMITREQLLFATTSVFLDVMVATLVAWAALLLIRHRDEDRWGPMVLLFLAGLLRPEAWLLSGALWLWRAARGRSDGRGLHLGQLALVAAAPAAWLVSDRILNGDALFSVHSTDRANAMLRAGLGIPDTLKEHVVAVPRNLAHAPGPELLLIGLVVALAVLWPRAGRVSVLRPRWPPEEQLAPLRLLIAGAALLGAAIFAESLAGAVLFARFALPAAALIVIVVACGLWALATSLSALIWKAGPGHAHAVLAGLVVVVCLVQAPLLSDARRVTQDEHARWSAARAAIRPGVPCTPIATPNANMRAYVAVWTGVRGGDVIDAATRGVPPAGTYVTATSREAQPLLRDPSFPQLEAFPPAAAVRTKNGWVITARCVPGG